MGRFMDAVFGDVQSSVRRDIDRVAQEARQHAPLGSGLIAESFAVGEEKTLRTLDGTIRRIVPVVEPQRDHVHADITPAQAERLKARWESTGCEDGPGRIPLPMAPMDVPAGSLFEEVIREHAERAINGGHDWVDVDLAESGEVVAWYCRKCDEQRYAEGW